MKRKSAYRVLAALVALATFVVGCSSDKKTDRAAAVSSSPARGSGGAADFVALGGWQDPACSASQPKVTVGISEPIEIAGTSLKDYVDGTQAAVEAFNARGGISGRCLDLKVCDGKGDGPTELSCARQETEDASMVAGLASTFLVSEGDAYQLFESAGLPQVGAQVALPGGWNSLRQLRVQHGRVRHPPGGHAGAQQCRSEEVRHLRSGHRPSGSAGRVRRSARQGPRHEPA